MKVSLSLVLLFSMPSLLYSQQSNTITDTTIEAAERLVGLPFMTTERACCAPFYWTLPPTTKLYPWRSDSFYSIRQMAYFIKDNRQPSFNFLENLYEEGKILTVGRAHQEDSEVENIRLILKNWDNSYFTSNWQSFFYTKTIQRLT